MSLSRFDSFDREWGEKKKEKERERVVQIRINVYGAPEYTVESLPQESITT